MRIWTRGRVQDMERPKVLTDHLMAAVEANPEDVAARSALADHLEEEGMTEHARRLAGLFHRWEDESYHGSPDWVCQDCKAAEWMEKRDGPKPCRKAVTAVIRQLREQLNAEWWEWRKVREAELRRRELVRKWGEF